ncbi:MAG: response regulator transcription factor [Anaerolineae bacterium]
MALILVVDDNRDLTKTLERALAQEGHEVLTAHSGPAGLSMMQRYQPHVVVLDVLLPDMDGFEVCRQARTLPELAKIPILFLTVKQHIDDVLRGFDAGGDDYLTKPFDLRELTARIYALLRRMNGSKPSMRELKVGPLTLDMATFQVHVGDRTAQLTPREYDLLYYMMRRAGTIVPVQRALQDVWGYEPYAGDPDLVRAHIRNLRLKIEPEPSNPVHIKTVPRHGYMIPYSHPSDDAGMDEEENPGAGGGSASVLAVS